MKFYVAVPEVHYQIVEIEAETEEDAFLEAYEANGEMKELEYSHTIEPYEIPWNVYTDTDEEGIDFKKVPETEDLFP